MGGMLEKVTAEYDRLISTMQYNESINTQIICNDCEFKGEVRFHPMGLKCRGCGGYNTINAGRRDNDVDDTDGMSE
jgi:RecJ-like exonuclease